jgi:hypothetical protein
MRRRRWPLVLAAVVVGVPALVYVAGLFVPRDHEARMSIDLSAPAPRIWSLITDFENSPRWRRDITSVRMQNVPGSPLRFIESSSQGDVTYEIVLQEAPRRQIVRIVDDDQPFGGTWTWQIEDAGAGSRVTITEKGFIKNPVFRVMGLLFFSPTDTIDTYLRHLAAELGEQAVPAAR